ncbi:MAG: hypothetical protein ACRENX_04675 [Candidatus Dormibacteria bacterium]
MVGALGFLAFGGSLVTLAASSPGYQILVADGSSGTIYVDNPSTGIVTEVPAPVAGGVRSLLLTPDGSLVYVAFNDGAIDVLATATDTYQTTPIDLGLTSSPAGMAFSSNGQDLYIAESGLNQVVELDTSTGSLIGSPILTGPVSRLALAANGGTLFFDGGSQEASLGGIATATNTVESIPPAVVDPGALVVSPDGDSLYVLSQSSANPAVVVVGASTGALIGSPIALPATSQPAQLALTPDGRDLYVTDGSGQAVATISIATSVLNASGVELPLGFTPGDIAITADGSTGLLDGSDAVGASELLSFDVASGAVGSPVALTGATHPSGIVIAPAETVPAPTPTPTPTPSCSPIIIGPIGPVGPVQVGPSSSPSPAIISRPGNLAPDPSPASTPSTGPSTNSTGISSICGCGGPVPPPATTSSTSSPANTTGTGSASSAVPTSSPANTTSASPPSRGNLSTPDASLPPATLPSPSPSSIICFGALPGIVGPRAALTAGAAAPQSGSDYLSLAVVFLALAGGAALAVWRLGWDWRKLPRLRPWRIR